MKQLKSILFLAICITNLSFNVEYVKASTYIDSNEETILTCGNRYVAINGNNSNDGTQDNPYQTIQYAIEEVCNGDTIFVDKGTYVKNINFNGKEIVVTSLWGAEMTIIDGNQNGSVVTFENGETNNAVLNGFTIANGTGTSMQIISGFGLYIIGGGILVRSHTSPTLQNLIVEDNTAQLGGGVGIVFGGMQQTIVKNCYINNNNVTESGGGLICTAGSYAEVSNSLFYRNIAVFGSAISSNYLSSIDLLNNTISNNTASQNGVIHLANQSTIQAENCIIWGNTPSNIFWQGGTSAMSTIDYSNVENGGGAIPNVAWGAGNIFASPPQFNNPSNDDYTLQFTSPCIDTGNSLNAPPTDINGIQRPQGSSFDMGAYEAIWGNAKCNSIKTTYTSAQNPAVGCCFDIHISNEIEDCFGPVSFSSLDSTLSNTWHLNDSINWNFTYTSNSGIHLATVSSSPIPTGTHSPISFCLDSTTHAPQNILVQWFGLDGVTCTDTLTIQPSVELIAYSTANVICADTCTQLHTIVENGDYIEWKPTYGLDNPNNFHPIACPDTTTTYTAKVYNTETGCFASQDVRIAVLSCNPCQDTVTVEGVCNSEGVLLTASINGDVIDLNSNSPYYTLTWDGTTTDYVNENPVSYPIGEAYTLKVGVMEDITQPDVCCHYELDLEAEGVFGVDIHATTDTICQFTCTQLEVNVSPNTSIEWLLANGIEDIYSSNPIVCPTETTTYIVEIFDRDTHCLMQDSITIYVDETCVCGEVEVELVHVWENNEVAQISELVTKVLINGVPIDPSNAEWLDINWDIANGTDIVDENSVVLPFGTKFQVYVTYGIDLNEPSECCHYYLEGIVENQAPPIAPPPKVSLYPNPAKNILNIQYNTPAKNAEIQILDFRGKTILQHKEHQETSNSNLDISNLRPAIYVVKIVLEGEETIFQRLAIIH